MRSRDIKRRQGIGKGKNFTNVTTLLRRTASRGSAFSHQFSRGLRRRGFRTNVVSFKKVQELFFRFCVVIAIILIILGGWRVLRPGKTIRVNPDTVAAFHVPHRAIGMLRTYAADHNINFAELFAVFNAENAFFPEKSATYDLSALLEMYIADFDRILRRYNRRSLAPYVEMFGNLFDEIEAFPIPTGWYDQDPSVMFGNSWGVEHNFQGNRMHRGSAIIDRENIRGRVPIVSMTAGHITDVGWCNQLGYFVGITTKNGSYYLYAHLNSLATGLNLGQIILAGQHLGQMGNTGGGRNSRSFPVHLHLAISPNVNFTRGEFWINPYPILRYLEARD